MFTLGMLCVYRIGFHIPIPGFDIDAIMNAAGTRDTDSPFGRAAEMMQIFTGGNLDNSSLFGLGIMPYITASIILMLVQEVVPALKKLRQEGQTGYKKIQEYTRYLTVPICFIQSWMYMRLLGGYTYPGMHVQAAIMGVVGMTAGTIFLMWLGEQIDEYGMGNGISLIIMAGIIARMPWALRKLMLSVSFNVAPPPGSIGPTTDSDSYMCVCFCCCRRYSDNAGPKTHTSSAGKDDAWPPHVWRPETLSAFAG